MDMTTFKSLRWTDILIDTVTDPRNIYRHISSGRFPALFATFIIPVAVALGEILAFSVLSQESSFFYIKVSYGWILASLYLIARVAFYSVMIDGTAQLLGYQGNVKHMLVLVNVSLFPGIFLLPLVHIFTVLNAAPIFFYAAFSLAISLWSLVILVRGVMDMHDVSLGRAFFLVAAPVALLGVFFVFTLILLAVMLFSSIPNISIPMM